MFFDKKYYVGRVIDIDDDEVTMKFLYNKPNSSHFDWPLRDDISSVDRKFIYYGPITVKGTVPFIFDVNNLLSQYNNFRCYMKTCSSYAS